VGDGSNQLAALARLPRTVAGMDALPAVHPRPGLPTRVSVYEVGPRDGLQAEKAVVPLPVKLELIDRLGEAGLGVIEATSFVSPRWVPQLADADELMAGLRRRPRVRYPVLVPNQQGFERAMAAGADELAIFVSATESFAQQNLGMTLDGAIEMAAPVVAAAGVRGIPVRGYVSMCFGDPWEGKVDPGRPADVAARIVELGCATISLGDTIGVATAGQVVAVLDRVEASGVPRDRIALHLHDTYGQALANVLAGLEAGITEFDSSAGGLGGCPYAKSATGNLATEDLVWMLDGLGIDTGVDMPVLVQTSRWLASELGRPSPSRVVAAWGA
jgi:hydroxymethylglutaryl-CoA lyase